jgi:hypothetical protein
VPSVVVVWFTGLPNWSVPVRVTLTFGIPLSVGSWKPSKSSVQPNIVTNFSWDTAQRRIVSIQFGVEAVWCKGSRYIDVLYPIGNQAGNRSGLCPGRAQSDVDGRRTTFRSGHCDRSGWSIGPSHGHVYGVGVIGRVTHRRHCKRYQNGWFQYSCRRGFRTAVGIGYRYRVRTCCQPYWVLQEAPLRLRKWFWYSHLHRLRLRCKCLP